MKDLIREAIQNYIDVEDGSPDQVHEALEKLSEVIEEARKPEDKGMNIEIEIEPRESPDRKAEAGDKMDKLDGLSSRGISC